MVLLPSLLLAASAATSAVAIVVPAGNGNAFVPPLPPRGGRQQRRSSSELGSSIPLVRRNTNNRVFATEEDVGIWAKAQADGLRAKYGAGGSSQKKRAQGFNLLTNQNADVSYFGNVAIGTPPVSYNVILDTGSADLWVAASNCFTGCGNVPSYDASRSSTYRNLSTPFQITYGSGAARGNLAQDTVQMAGFSVPSQTFAAVDAASANLLTSPVSGLLGLGFQSIASSRAKPLWQTLVDGGSWDQPLMSFVLTRYLNVSNARDEEPGGIFTMGYLDQSLYTGDIEYTSLSASTYWLIPLTGITVNGNSALSSSQGAAIDTGTTLVGGPAEQIAQIYAQIPGSEIGTGNYEGYYLYPCNTDVEVQMTFGGGRAWSIPAADFVLQRATASQCIGAFFSIDLSGSSAPSWIVGDTFLKNVMSVYRYNPPSVGFAALAQGATASFRSVPSPTVGQNPVTPTNNGGGSGGGSGGNGAGFARWDTTALQAGSLWTMMAVFGGVLLAGFF